MTSTAPQGTVQRWEAAGDMSDHFDFDDAARLPQPGDNAAVATRFLAAGTRVHHKQGDFTLDWSVLEGHRFTVQPVSRGEALLSWGLPFGYAMRDLRAGTYLINARTLEALQGRRITFALPAEPNFEDFSEPYRLDKANLRAVKQVERYDNPGTFMGYRREGGRGVGTRNYVVLLGINSHSAAFAKRLAEGLQAQASLYPNLDGVVAVAHTEGCDLKASNREEVLHSLAGFVLHPNVGAVLTVDYPGDALDNALLRDWMAAHGRTLDAQRHAWLSLTGSFEADLVRGEGLVRGWLPGVNACRRTAEPLSTLKLALQCGGSDAFSGISGNPLAAWVARELIRQGGSANLGETAELVGAEPYMLQRVRDAETAQAFLDAIERLKARARWHGTSAEGNPSGGNRYRGLYNITLKSIGAARKRHSNVRLDAVIDYAQAMIEPGFYFMDSPGNDLECIAGQVAAGCNLILFVTGNGSVTNFPFVPTIKVVTTSGRCRMLPNEMDVNAGRCLEGTPLDELGAETWALVQSVACGQHSMGERAGHVQVQLWRSWPQCGPDGLQRLLTAAQPDGLPAPVRTRVGERLPQIRMRLLDTGRGFISQQVGLVLPNSLCSAQVARLAAERLNREAGTKSTGLTHYLALEHTEGCGTSDQALPTAVRVLCGYLKHPMVGQALLLEHGCEKLLNDVMRREVASAGLDPERLGWASVQLDGGLQAVIGRIVAWFGEHSSAYRKPKTALVGLDAVRIAMITDGEVPAEAAAALGRLARWITSAGGSVILAEGEGLWTQDAFQEEFKAEVGGPPGATLAYAQQPAGEGLHVMQGGNDWNERLTGLGAAGVGLFIGYQGRHPLPGNPLVPLLRTVLADQLAEGYRADMDLLLQGDPQDWARCMLEKAVDMLAGGCQPAAARNGDTAFQIWRGPLGLTL